MTDEQPKPDPIAEQLQSDEDAAKAVQLTIANTIYNRGLGHSLETCEAIADEIMQALSDLK